LGTFLNLKSKKDYEPQQKQILQQQVQSAQHNNLNSNLQGVNSILYTAILHF
jgi:hypothetical protein